MGSGAADLATVCARTSGAKVMIVTITKNVLIRFRMSKLSLCAHPTVTITKTGLLWQLHASSCSGLWLRFASYQLFAIREHDFLQNTDGGAILGGV